MLNALSLTIKPPRIMIEAPNIIIEAPSIMMEEPNIMVNPPSIMTQALNITALNHLRQLWLSISLACVYNAVLFLYIQFATPLSSHVNAGMKLH